MNPKVIATIVALCAIPNATAWAGASDYQFEPVQARVKAGDDATIAVRLTHKANGKPVADAVVFRTRIDMAPDGMAEMAAKLAQLPNPEPGIYAFKTGLAMEGRWQLSVAAKVQGEPETVIGKITFNASE